MLDKVAILLCWRHDILPGGEPRLRAMAHSRGQKTQSGCGTSRPHRTACPIGKVHAVRKEGTACQNATDGESTVPSLCLFCRLPVADAVFGRESLMDSQEKFSEAAHFY